MTLFKTRHKHVSYDFRFGRHYEIPLLIQSILMNIAMFALIHLCVNVNAKDRIAAQSKEHVFSGLNLN